MIELLAHIVREVLVVGLLALQVADTISTNMALARPNVIEVGDASIGLPNFAGWAQRRWGRFWWLIKGWGVLFLPLIAIDLPLAAEPAIIFLLVGANGYFFKLVVNNLNNAKG